MATLKDHSKRIALEGTGWLLVVLGLAAIVLPGPGLLLLVAGLALLSTQYEWAERRLAPVKRQAFKTARESVETWPRIFISGIFSMLLVALGIIWGLQPAVPGWWPLADKYWLVGGWGTGATIIVSGCLALGILVYSTIALRPSKHKH